MKQIRPYPLWIGHAGDGRAFQEIFNKGIKAVVQLAMEEPPPQFPRELIYLRFPLLDGGGNDPALLQFAINCVATLIQRRISTLVCCGAGMSRSPAIIASALSIVEHTNAEECLRRVTQAHAADVSPEFWQTCRHAMF